MSFKKSLLLLTTAFIVGFNPGSLWACACGCYVFDVQTSAMLPTHPGGMAWLEYDYMDQNKNWSGTSQAPSENNEDKEIRTNFVTAGAQYMFNRSWGIVGDVPYWHRHFETTDDNGNIVNFNHGALGDIRIRGIYTGFSSDMSSGITFGLKLPTGDYEYPNFDRDSSIGTGSTDLLLGAFHQGAITADNVWSWFVNGLWDQPTLTMGGYSPGAEIDGVFGGYYNGWRPGGVKIAPMAQMVGAYRWRDGGVQGDLYDSGYQRILVGPGIEVKSGVWSVDGAVSFPVYQNFNGDQLVASELYRISVSRSF